MVRDKLIDPCVRRGDHFGSVRWLNRFHSRTPRGFTDEFQRLTPVEHVKDLCCSAFDLLHQVSGWGTLLILHIHET